VCRRVIGFVWAFRPCKRSAEVKTKRAFAARA
jgi:hypothetical protein